MKWDKEAVEALAKMMADYDLNEISLENGEEKITVRKDARGSAIPNTDIPYGYSPTNHRANHAGMLLNFDAITKAKALQDEASGHQHESQLHSQQIGSVPKEKALASADESVIAVTATMAGVFYRRPAPDKAPYVEVGQHVKKGDTLCLIEAMKMLNEVTAPAEGMVAEILPENEQFVEYGSQLILLRKDTDHV